jgi:hypothetical protein
MPDAETHTFSLGVNFPWRNHGQDFGCTNGEYKGISEAATRNTIAVAPAQLREWSAEESCEGRLIKG